MSPLAGANRTEITNEEGNWDMGDEPGKEGVVFLLNDGKAPLNTIQMNHSYLLDAQEMESTDDHSTYDVANGESNGTPVLQITRTDMHSTGYSTTLVYTIDSATGALLSTQSPGSNPIRQVFDLAPDIDDSAFDVPKSLVAVPVLDAQAAQRYLYDHK
jgi:hypothetical protein